MEISLIDLKEGLKAEVIRINGGFGMQQHLGSLGVQVGSIITKVPIIQERGPVMVEIEGNRISIGKEMARNIIVSEVNEK